jgi:adenosine/AMP kinase
LFCGTMTGLYFILFLRLDIFRKIYFHYSIAGRVDTRREEHMELNSIRIDVLEGCNIILGQTHFIKTAEDLYEAVVTAVPQAKFGIAFTEASGPCLIRTEGNDNELVDACANNLREIGAGHVFCILLKNAFPINVLNQVKNCPEVCSIFCATANPVEVVVAATSQGKGILGVIDGFSPKGVETPEDRGHRKEFLRKIGYKL